MSCDQAISFIFELLKGCFRDSLKILMYFFSLINYFENHSSRMKNVFIVFSVVPHDSLLTQSSLLKPHVGGEKNY